VRTFGRYRGLRRRLILRFLEITFARGEKGCMYFMVMVDVKDDGM
jgi:hypothetical protein